MSEFYSCKLENINQLIIFPSINVRWIDINDDVDFSLVYEYYRVVFNSNLQKEWFEVNQWKICAYILDGKIVSFAGALYMTERNWEIGAVSTHPQYRKNGYAKAVCSFVAKYILDNNKQATCNTENNNQSMIKVMQDIGMTLQ